MKNKSENNTYEIFNLTEYVRKNPDYISLIQNEKKSKFLDMLQVCFKRENAKHCIIKGASALIIKYFPYSIANRFLKIEDYKDYTVINLDYSENFDFLSGDLDNFFDSLIKKKYSKKVFVIVNLETDKPIASDLKCFLKASAEKMAKFEDLHYIFFNLDPNFDYDDSEIVEPFQRCDWIELEELDVFRYDEVLKDLIKDLSFKYGNIRYSEKILEYFVLLYQNFYFDSVSLENYYDSLDIAFCYAKENNHSKLKKSDINLAFANSPVISARSKNAKVTAYHEAGHCVVNSVLFKSEKNVEFISIIPDNKNNLGMCSSLDFPVNSNIDYEKCIKYVAYGLAGAIAEKLIGEFYNTGAWYDLKESNKFIEDWLLISGANKRIGKFSYYKSTKKLSNKKKEILEEEKEKMLKKAAKLAKKTLKENKKLLDELADLLIKKKILSKRQIQEVLKKYIK